jgi:hypothetical protein
MFENNEVAMKHLRRVFSNTECVFFHGHYTIPVDPLITDKQRVQMTAHDIWKATGYRFR